MENIKFMDYAKLQQITSASQLIDRRSALDYSKLKGYALNYDRKNKK